jgi:hypothetical protein
MGIKGCNKNCLSHAHAITNIAHTVRPRARLPVLSLGHEENSAARHAPAILDFVHIDGHLLSPLDEIRIAEPREMSRNIDPTPDNKTYRYSGKGKWM